ncbi:MAG: bifunctional metallophosphatase/5'-nucleotidase [Deltaproteobacteria bacterium]|nr:bifunctional metallophosphatase/5'-nucleotidase [Deltaproteobacteria bacterium]
MVVALVATVGCAPAAPAPDLPTAEPTAPASDGTGPVDISVLYTSDEHGWVLPFEHEGRQRGGAAQLLAQLVKTEGHCAGELPVQRIEPDPSATLELGKQTSASSKDAEPPFTPRPDRCEQSNTVLLSGGDNYAGPVISGYFRGATMAAAMARLGYAAAAFGNHEFDYGRAAFFANRARAGMPYLAANMKGTEPGGQNVTLPYVVLRRAGVDLGVIGLATKDTLATAMASRFRGIGFVEEEQALAKTVPEVWGQGVDAIVVLVHECRDRLLPVLERHPEWQLSFVGFGHCHRSGVGEAAGTPVAAPGWRLDHYVRVRLRIDPSGSGPRRAQVLSNDLVPVVATADQALPSVDPIFDQRIAAWQQAVEQAFGEVIGHSVSGIARKSASIGQWVVRAWRDELSADVALTTRGAIRQEVPAGPITLSTVYGVLPFENTLIVSRILGRDLPTVLSVDRTVYAGVERKPDGSFALPSGEPIDPERRYRVVSTDYLYLNGDRYPLQKLDPEADRTGTDWRTPVVSWTRRLGTTAARPLEAALASP